MFIRINGQNVNSQILPVDSPTLDETLETLSFVLVSNTQSMPYAPCQEVEIVTDNLETIRFFLVSDNVEVASANPLRFKHTITCVQNTRYLSKHLVRNSVFSTPAYLTKESYNAATITLSNRTKDPDDINYGLSVRGNYRASALITVNNNIKPLNLTKLNLNFREKIKAAYIEINCQAVRCPMGQEGTELPGTGNSVWVNNLSDKNSFQSPTIGSTSNWTFGNNLILHCEKENGTVLEETINPTNLGVTAADWYPLNKKIRYARIEELASQGYVTFYIKFPAQLETFLDATVYPYRGNFWFFFMFQAKIVAETYYYNTYEILSLLRLRQQKSRLGPGVLERRQEDPLFELPAYNTELGKLLESTPAPNFTFTQNTMYECIAEVFRLFDAIFTIGQNKRLGIEYFNERNGTNVTETLKKTGQK